jgi:hypothetical protein
VPKPGRNDVTSCPGATVSGTGAEYPAIPITGVFDCANTIPARTMTIRNLCNRKANPPEAKMEAGVVILFYHREEDPTA